MQIRDIMTRSVEFIAVDASVADAARKMAAEDIGFLPVLSDGELVGVITDRDITLRAVAKGLDSQQIEVKDAMTANVATLPENGDLEDASDLMEERNVRRLVVTDEHDKPVGVISKDKLALYLGVYGMDDGLPPDTKEFPDDFDPAAMAGPEKEAGMPSAGDIGQIRPLRRSTRDQGDPE